MQNTGPASLLFRSLTGALLCVLLGVAASAQQPSRLPPVFAPDSPLVEGPLGPSVNLDRSSPSDPFYVAHQPEQTAPLVDEESEPSGPPGARDGVFQKITFQGTWLPAMTDGDLGFSDLELSTVWGFPLPSRESPLLITPGFAVHYIDGPDGPDLPPRLYDAYVQFRWIRPLTERWIMDVAVTPGVYSDFEMDDDDALRITGRSLGIFKWTPTTTLVLGVAYLDRTDVGVLPVGGVIWKPNDDWSFEIVAPRPRIAQRILTCGYDSCEEYWTYIAGEFGGGQWAITRAGGAQDIATVRDYRLLFGLERKCIGGLTTQFEIGYVFGRTLEYNSGTPDFKPDDTLLLRLGASY